MSLNPRTFILIAIAIAVVALGTIARAAPRRIVLSGSTSPTPGEHRVALVIGNTHYGGVNELKNPVNDAHAIANALSNLGFTTTLLLDADRTSLRDAVHDFKETIVRSGPHTVALLYYSGHGMQVNGVNYLIPIGFQAPSSEDFIDDYAYPAQTALDQMQAANAQINIVILDACRNNPFETTRSWGGQGLAKMEAEGVYVCYATADGKTAEDNPSAANGLYTQELLKNIRTPGLDIEQVFRRTGKAVRAATNGRQFPYIYDGLSDDFYFAGPPGTRPFAPVAGLRPPLHIGPVIGLRPPYHPGLAPARPGKLAMVALWANPDGSPPTKPGALTEATIKAALLAGADVNAADRGGVTTLTVAATYCPLNTVKLLVTERANVNTKNIDGWTPLMGAASNGRVDVIRFLIAHGVDVNARDILGKTALTYAMVSRSTTLSAKSVTIAALKMAGARE